MLDAARCVAPQQSRARRSVPPQDSMYKVRLIDVTLILNITRKVMFRSNAFADVSRILVIPLNMAPRRP
ncbi:hypothetical protein ACHAQH_009140 [Verticillium albo-atrum]